MTEVWKDVKNYEGLYQISNLGNVKRVSSRKRLKPYNRKGYIRVALSKDNIAKHMDIHRLVAEAFIPNPENKPEINHIDGDKSNNKVSNLEWCTRKENMNHAKNTGLWKMTDDMKKGLDQSKRTYQYDRNYNFIQSFKSAEEASRQLHINTGNLHSCCEGKRKTAGGYIWSYEKRGGDYN